MKLLFLLSSLETTHRLHVAGYVDLITHIVATLLTLPLFLSSKEFKDDEFKLRQVAWCSINQIEIVKNVAHLECRVGWWVRKGGVKS